jgi:hypothetical protein
LFQIAILESWKLLAFGLIYTSSILRSVTHLDAQGGSDELRGWASGAVALEHPYNVSMALEASACYRGEPMKTLRSVNIGTPGD